MFLQTLQLCTVTLSLFETLVGLNCEDVMLWLVFRHLIPMDHLVPCQRPSIKQPDLHGRASERYVSTSRKIQNNTFIYMWHWLYAIYLKNNKLVFFNRLLSMTPICCLEASSNSSQPTNTDIQLSSSNASYNNRGSSSSSVVNPTQANQVWRHFNILMIRWLPKDAAFWVICDLH